MFPSGSCVHSENILEAQSIASSITSGVKSPRGFIDYVNRPDIMINYLMAHHF